MLVYSVLGKIILSITPFYSILKKTSEDKNENLKRVCRFSLVRDSI
jgi:hypothetical protein